MGYNNPGIYIFKWITEACSAFPLFHRSYNELNKNSSFFVLWGNNYLLSGAGQPGFSVQ